MEERTRALLVAALLLATPSALAAWDQTHGAATRNPFVGLPAGPLDVLANGTLPDGLQVSALWGAGVVDSPHGIIIAARDEDGQCVLLVYADPAASTPSARNTVQECDEARLIGYDRVADSVILCSDSAGVAPVVHAVRPLDGTRIWALLPAALDPPVEGIWSWSCESGALDVETRMLYAPFNVFTAAGAISIPRVAGISLDTGEPEWVARYPSQDVVPATNVGGLQPERMEITFINGLTLTQSGLIVTGWAPCDTQGICQEGILAWYTLGGNVRGSERASLGKTSALGALGAGGGVASIAHAVSTYATARGAIAASVSGPDIILINPESARPVLRAPLKGFESAVTNVFWRGGSWSEDVLVVGFPHSLSAYEPANLEPRWSWTLGLSWAVVGTISTESGTLFALLSDDNANEQRFVEIRARDGKFLRSTALYLNTQDQGGGWDAHLAVHDDRQIVIVSELGALLVLGLATDDIPPLSISSAYPPIGSDVTLAAPSGGAERYQVNWGDGTEEDLAQGAVASHTYPERGDHEVRLRALLPGGLTRTSAQVIHVGETPPPQLTTLQKAFSPEYQNWTFFLLGLAVTVVGVAFTVGRQRRRFNKLERELAAVEEIRMLSVQDPRAAVLALKSYRDRLPSDLARRRIDDSQYQVLDIRSARLLKVLRTRMFSPHDARLSTRYHRLVDAAFEDAILQPSERDALIAALDAEDALQPDERERIVAILADFTSARPDLH